jgi:hypothetical protein
MDRIKLSLLALSIFSFSQFARAGETAYKYKMNLFFGLKESCTIDGKKELSQVRFHIDNEELDSRKSLIAAEARISACIITGSLIKEHYPLILPRFLFSDEAPIQGTFPINGHPFLAKISISEVRQGTYKLQYTEKSGKAWKVIDSIEITKSIKGPYPEKIKFDVTSKNQTIEAKLRLIEKK